MSNELRLVEENASLRARLEALETEAARVRAAAERKEAVAERHRFLLRLVALGSPLREVLDQVARTCELLSPRVRCAIYVRERGCLNLVAHPSIPEAFAKATATIRVASDVGSCGAAAFSKQCVVVDDIAHDPRWAPYRDLAEQSGLRACWSMPLLTGTDEVVGTLSGYLDEARPPSPEEREVLAAMTDIALVAIESHNASAQLRLMDTAIAHISDLIVLTEAAPLDEPGPRIKFVNRAFEKLTGWTRDEVLDRSPRLLQGPKTDREALRRIRLAVERQEPIRETILNYTKAGAELWLEIDIVPLRDADGSCTHLVSIERDITRRRQLEEELRHAQKMEAIAVLAGGVAHDFNNLLSIVLTTAALVREDLSPHDPVSEEIEQIELAAQRGAALTRQLLAFGRHQMLAPRTLDLNATITALLPMLRRVAGHGIELTCHLDPTLGTLHADPGQIERVIINLVVNARDAMPDGGSLTLATQQVDVGAGNCRGEPHGSYASLVVTDTGIGMDPETRSRIFEPFFTTKAQGKGTGLGLSTVFGIVTQSGGEVFCASEPGRGSRFEVRLPQTQGSAAPTAASDDEAYLLRGTEGVLLVAEDDAVRRAIRQVLVRAGYRVFEAASPGDALLVAEEHPASIDLIITDAAMPRMSGARLVERLGLIIPDLRALLMSAPGRESVSDAAHVLETPIIPQALLKKVREALRTPTESAALRSR